MLLRSLELKSKETKHVYRTGFWILNNILYIKGIAIVLLYIVIFNERQIPIDFQINSFKVKFTVTKK